MITGKNYIGNQLSAKGTKTYKTFNPLLNIENKKIFYEATPGEIDDAVALAVQSFREFKNISRLRKVEFLTTIADEMLALGDKLRDVYCLESGLPKDRFKGELHRTIGQLRMFADLVKEGSWLEATIDTAIPDRTPIPKPDVRKILVPIGPVVVFGASNFPLAYSTAGGDTVSALAAGCPVIIKSHPMHAGTGELVASAIIKAVKKTAMPNGIFSNLNSSDINVGVQLVQHPDIEAIGFTGSIQGGRALYDLASQRKEPIPVFAEMGSINPIVLLPKATRTRGQSIAKTIANSITLGTGQFCTNPGLILGIQGDLLNEFIQNLSDEIIKIVPTCMLHPTIIGNYKKNKTKALQQKGTTIIADYTKQVANNFARQTVILVSGEIFLENITLHQEVFGPFSMIVQCKDATQLETIISKLEGQLTGTIVADDNELSNYSQVVEALKDRVGRIIYNGVPIGVEVCPSMQHGGPYPASTDSRFTAVGIHSIKRWVRPFSFQNWPNDLLPDELKSKNPLGISRFVNGKQII